MIKCKIPYNTIGILFMLRHWVVFCFLLIILAKPIINLTILLVETKYELSESLFQENIEEKENITSEDDTEKLYNLIVFNSNTSTKQSLSYFDIQEHFLNYKPDILIPPPRNSHHYHTFLAV